MKVYFTTSGKSNLYITGEDINIIAIEGYVFAYNKNIVTVIDEKGNKKYIDDLDYALKYCKFAPIYVTYKQGINADVQCASNTLYITIDKYNSTEFKQYKSIPWIRESILHVKESLRGELDTRENILDIQGVYSLDVDDKMVEEYIKLIYIRNIQRKLRASSTNKEIVGILKVVKHNLCDSVHKQCNIDNNVLIEYLTKYVQSCHTVNNMTLNDLVIGVGHVEFSKYRDNNTKYNDMVSVSIYLRTGLKREAKLKLIKKFSGEINRLVIDKLNKSKQFQNMGVPINFFSVERVLTNDSQLIYRLSIKEIKDTGSK